MIGVDRHSHIIGKNSFGDISVIASCLCDQLRVETLRNIHELPPHQMSKPGYFRSCDHRGVSREMVFLCSSLKPKAGKGGCESPGWLPSQRGIPTAVKAAAWFKAILAVAQPHNCSPLLTEPSEQERRSGGKRTTV